MTECRRDVPEGQIRIAQRFQRWDEPRASPSPEGTAELIKCTRNSENRPYAVRQDEGTASSTDTEAVFTFCDTTASACGDTTSAPAFGIGRAATPKNARQRTKEMQTQQISMIVMGLNAALGVPCPTCP